MTGALVPLQGTYDQHAVRRQLQLLSSLWVQTMGQSLGELDADLELCKRWFDPVAQGQRLRRELADLPDAPGPEEELVEPWEPWTVWVGPRKLLITPEGRCAIDLLQRAAANDGPVTITDSDVARYDRLLGEMYRRWSRHRLESVVALLAGKTKPLQIPAAGVVIALLVNGCIGQQRALTRFASGSGRAIVDRAFFSAVNAFADVLAPSRRGKRDSRLISGWMLYEARRRLGDALVVQDFKGTTDGHVWIRPDGVDHVIDVVARDLVRGHRARATPGLFADAFDALVAALRAELPSLAGFSAVHERPSETRRLKQQMVQQLQVYASRES